MSNSILFDAIASAMGSVTSNITSNITFGTSKYARFAEVQKENMAALVKKEQ